MRVKEFLAQFELTMEGAVELIKKFLMETKTITTHNGSFHEDDAKAVALALVFAERVLKIDPKEIHINRSRSNLVGLVVDVGEGFLDHHNKEVFAEYESGTRYAAAGLLFEYIGRLLVPSEEEFLRIKNTVFLPGDAADNGDFSMIGTSPSFAAMLSQASSPENRDEFFIKTVDMYKSYLEACFDISIKKERDRQYSYDCLQKALAENKKYVFFEKSCEADFAMLSNAGIKFVAMPNDEPGTDDKYEAMSLRCEAREYFPEIINGNSVWGLRKEELSKASGIENMEFIHKDGFFATTKTKEAMQSLLDLV